MKAAVRVNSLTLGGSGPRTLEAMEKHGKRLDLSGRRRRVRDLPPLVYKGLDLREAFDAHVAGANMNAGLKRPVLHMIVQFPAEVLTDDAPAPFLRAGGTDERVRLMGRQAIRFAQETHGNDAVFAARVDRDEAGQLTVDLFLAPKYEKVTKTGKSSVWVSTTKHGKELAQKHQAEIQRRHPRAKGKLTGPRHVGIALQEEFAVFFERHNRVKLTRTLKDGSRPDRLEVEAFKAVAVARVEAEAEAVEVLAKAQTDAERIRQLARHEGLEAGRAEAQAEVDELRSWAERVSGTLSRYLRPLRDFLREEVAAEASLLARGKVMFGEGASLLKGLKELREALDRAAAGYRTGVLGEMQRWQDGPILAAYQATGVASGPTPYVFEDTPEGPSPAP